MHHRVAGDRSVFQGLLDRLPQCAHGVLLQESQDPDVFAHSYFE